MDDTGRFGPLKAKASGLHLYLYREKEKLKAYIIPIESRGLWGKIKGYMALENDGTTVAGFTVYSHSETPGLGGEIEKAWFQKNFIGKKIYNSEGNFVSIAIAKGHVSNLPQAQQSHYVDGISGATLTGALPDLGAEAEPGTIRGRFHPAAPAKRSIKWAMKPSP